MLVGHPRANENQLRLLVSQDEPLPGVLVLLIWLTYYAWHFDGIKSNNQKSFGTPLQSVTALIKMK
jgi:hypothetical protein